MLLREVDPISVATAAEFARVTERAVRYWLSAQGGASSPRMGRPAYPPEVRWQVFWIVLRLWRRMPQRAGWRTVLAAAGGMLPVRLVQESLREIKRIYKARSDRGRARRRRCVRPLAANALWHMDATHLGRTQDGEEVQAQAVRDAARPTVLAATVGRVVTTEDAIRALVAAILVAGALPLVLVTDNGPAYTSGLFTALLRALRIVHLRNLPHTPEHNARAERVFRDWKDDEELGLGVLLPDLDTAAVRVVRACAAQESVADALARPLPLTQLYTDDQRERLCWAVRRRIDRTVLPDQTARERRLAEREAILTELELRELIQRTRGGAPLAARETEEVS